MTYLLGDGRKATSLTSFLFLTLSETAELGEAYRHEHRYEMNRIRFCVITVLLILGAFTAAADIKVRDVCPMLKFQGEVIKNKATKQKEPSGQGTLFVPENSRSNYIEFKGDFHGNEIDNAVLQFCEGHTFEGTATYSYEYDKDDKCLTLTVNFIDGTLNWDGKMTSYYSRAKGTHSAKINSHTKHFGYRLTFKGSKESNRYSINPFYEEFWYNSKLYPEEIDESVGKMIVDNQWVAKLDPKSDRWELYWLYGKMCNGMYITRKDPDSHDFYFTGNNDKTYIDNSSDVKLRFPLQDGGFFEWDKENHHIKLIYPSGDSFIGSFSKVPFEFERGSSKGILDFSAYIHYDRSTDPTQYLFSQLSSATVSDFIPYEGIYTFANGERDYMAKGHSIGKNILVANGGNPVPDFVDIVLTHIPVDRGYDGIVEKMLNKRSNYDVSDGARQFDKLSRGILYYAGKQNGDELDKELYLKSPQYRRDLETYDSLRSVQKFYSTQYLKTITFSTSGIVLEIDDRYAWYNDKLRILSIGEKGPFFPFKGSCSHPYEIEIDVHISNYEALKLLKERQENLKLLVTYKAGEWSDYVDKAIANPTGLYLYDKSNGAILYDMSSLLGNYSSRDIKSKTNSARQADAEAERRDEAERARRYHQQAIRQKCNWCLGRGYTDGWMGKRIECTQCHGRGYVYTHYYDD